MPVRLTPLLVAAMVALVAGIVGYQGFASRGNPWQSMFKNGSAQSTSLVGEPQVRPAFDGQAGSTMNSAPDNPTIVAQDTTQADPPAAVAQETSPAVDESALRYFARQGDTRRLEAEIARLRALYPGWIPPENPLALPPAGDPQLDRMWQTYAQGRYAEARKAIADRQASEPGWQPPADLIQLLSVGETREQLVNASNLKQHETVIRLASETPSLLICADIDVLWRVAEAFAVTNKLDRAQAAYRYILENCEDPKERYASMQKAMVLMPRSQIDILLGLERKGADGVGEFTGIRDELARQSLVAADSDKTRVVSATDLTRVEALAEKEGKPADALLLGWHHLRRNKFEQAANWFQRARQREDSASASQGLGLALLGQSRPAEAESVLYPWRDADDELRKSYLAAAANLLAADPPAQIEPNVLQRIVAAVVPAKDSVVAQQLGWYSYTLNQFETASLWFEQALAWKVDDEPSAFGLVLSRLRLGDRAGVAAIQNLWKGRSERIMSLGVTASQSTARQLGERQVAAGSQGPSRGPIAPRQSVPQSVVPTETSPATPSVAAPRQATSRRNCTSTILPETLSPASALDRGWCLMDMNRPLEAAAAFEIALRSGSEVARRDAAYGQSLAYLRAGLSDKAAVSAAKAPQDRQRSVELQTALLADRALIAFEARRYVEALLALDQLDAIAPRRVDLMVLRGYAYMNLRRFSDARQVFQAVAATGNVEGAKGLADLKEAQESRLR
jgi:tetratricopeptide (TPR) repeat protein